MKDDIVWQGRSSQIPNIPYFLLFSWTVLLPIVRYLKTRFVHYSVSTERLIVKEGIFSQSINEIELYRVRDYSTYKPFLLRIFGLGHLEIISSDRTQPTLRLVAIKNPEHLMKVLRDLVESARKTTQTREVDYT